ncbi:MAG: aminotransferase class V-fold PLP-dependent enzyme [Steroidobacteraceae bacterium]
MPDRRLSLESLRDAIVGIDTDIETPFGTRPLVYCDYTASGRSLLFVERYLQGLLQTYANTHTEDDVTGRGTSQLLHQAEQSIKRAVNAGPEGRVVACGTGATGAIARLQQLLGVAIPPATRARLDATLQDCLGTEGAQAFASHQSASQPVVFVGPYEHHSNEISWRQGLATVVEVELARDGGIDLDHLERLLTDPAWAGRDKIGAFSAASNVTGMKSDVQAIAALLHRHGALACFDYAASAPYVEIDMNPGGEGWLDAVFLSPHKFLGGPGSSGILVFNQRLYRRELPPSFAGGGTVEYVSPSDQDFIADIEEREKAGTPGILQTLRAALAFEIKSEITPEAIEAREQALLQKAFAAWHGEPGIEILGNPDPARRIGIVSFNLRDPRGGGYLHPKFVTALLNDLFGIQSRAGCSCAGPYGHRLLGIGLDLSERYREWVRKGYHGIKPGWCRVGFHFSMDDLDAGYVIDAVRFIAREGHRFLPLYRFDPLDGSWRHEASTAPDVALSLAAALEAPPLQSTARPARERAAGYAAHLAAAQTLAASLMPQAARPMPAVAGFGDLQFFTH